MLCTESNTIHFVIDSIDKYIYYCFGYTSTEPQYHKTQTREDEQMRKLHISAGGANTRLREYIYTNFGKIPKHLLPIPTPEGTILGQIMRDAETYFDRMTVWTSKGNIADFLPLVQKHKRANYVVDTYMTGPLGPLIRQAMQYRARSYACAGDFYCPFSWKEMERFHDGHDRPITILLTQSLPAADAAVFELAEDGGVTGWSRRDSTATDLINIGAYIIDPTPEVREMLAMLDRHKEDPFNTAAIDRGMLAGYVPDGMGFNVNTSSSYKLLLAHLER